MKATNEQIIREAHRRYDAAPIERMWSLSDYVIEVMRENWTPPDPVDPALIVAREVLAVEWEKKSYPHHADAARKGRYDAEVPILAARAAYKHQLDEARVAAAAALELLDGGSKQTAIIEAAQEILTRYLLPDGLDHHEALRALLLLLDGPEQRLAQARWDAAIGPYHRLQKETAQ